MQEHQAVTIAKKHVCVNMKRGSVTFIDEKWMASITIIVIYERSNNFRLRPMGGGYTIVLRLLSLNLHKTIVSDNEQSSDNGSVSNRPKCKKTIYQKLWIM
ncbi:uncharacterized protein LOC122529411 isoform X1 [Frieseomelitta varia]|uniref:uncharacterized protein LOC122529411 isoform X1 n=1 Tax=Frieseomelitta varia TaxID=561572 RepID=UPI001CB67E9B|nr:uncharacterized protein LOC122529411 isoform X1 [Frieseomelitta varia]